MKATRQKIMVIRIHKSSDRNELIVNMSRTLSCCRNETESKRVRITTEFFFFQDREAYRDKYILGHDRRLQGNLTNSELYSVNKLSILNRWCTCDKVHRYIFQDIHCQPIIFTSVKSTV